jgi:hypothetical protein
LPDDKSTVGVDSALRDLRVTKVRARASHLSYQGWAAGSPHLDVVLRDDPGPVVLALGTVSFIAEVLSLLEAPVGQWWAPTATVEPASGHRPG